MSIEAVNINNAGLIHVAKVKNLRELRLWAPAITDDGLRALGEMNDLESLDLEGTNVRGSGLSALSKLTQLTLGSSTQDDDLAVLASLPLLEELDLRSCRQLTDACAKTIVQHQQLRMVWLPPQVGTAGKQAIRESLPKCQVR